MIKDFLFGPWLPDQTDLKNPGLERCINAIPGASGYSPALAPVAVGGSITGTILGAYAFARSDGTPVIVCANATDLFHIVGGVVTGSSLSLSLTGAVVFERYNSKIYASSRGADTWVLDDIEADTAFVAASNTIPSANALARVDDFLIAGDLDDIDASAVPNRLRWSPFNNPGGTWGTDIATQADFVDLDPEYGPIMGVSGGSFGMVFQRSGISRLDTTGGASVFGLEIYEKNRGCVAPSSIVRVGDTAYFLSYDGFFSTDGSSTAPISQGKIWKWFLANANQAFIASVSGAADFQNRCIVWAFAGGDSNDLTGQLWYNWETAQWSYVEQPVQALVSATKAGQTLEQVAIDYPDLDVMDISLDSPTFRASGRTLLAFVSGDLSGFTGNTLPATFEGGEMQPQPGRRSFIRSVAPLIEEGSAAITTRLGCKETMTSDFVASSVSDMGPLGFCPFNHDARYFRVTNEIPAGADWSNAYGYQIDFTVSALT